MSNDKNQILGAIQDTLNEVQEILAKSGMPMEKAEGDEMPPPAPEHDEAAEQAAGDEGAAPAAPEAGAEEGAAPAGEEGQGEPDMAAALAEQAQQLSDEELDHMIEALMSEKEHRHGGEGQGEGAPMPAEAAPAAPAGDEAEKSMKSEFASLAKSMGGIADAVTKLTKEVTDLKSTKAAPTVRVTSKPAAANKQSVQVLEKSTPVKQRLNKSETLHFAEGEIRRGNKSVSPMLIAEINLTQTAQELAQVQDRMAMDGVKFPEKN